MVRCKQITENNPSKCGKNICCFTCDTTEGCECSCPALSDEDDYKSCEDAEEIPDDLMTIENQYPDVIKAITDLCIQQKKIDEQMTSLKESLQSAMEQFGVKKFENEVIAVTYVAPTTRSSIDSTKLKKELPDIAEKYTKTSDVKASVRIKVK